MQFALQILFAVLGVCLFHDMTSMEHTPTATNQNSDLSSSTCNNSTCVIPPPPPPSDPAKPSLLFFGARTNQTLPVFYLSTDIISVALQVPAGIQYQTVQWYVNNVRIKTNHTNSILVDIASFNSQYSQYPQSVLAFLIGSNTPNSVVQGSVFILPLPTNNGYLYLPHFPNGIAAPSTVPAIDPATVAGSISSIIDTTMSKSNTNLTVLSLQRIYFMCILSPQQQEFVRIFLDDDVVVTIAIVGPNGNVLERVAFGSSTTGIYRASFNPQIFAVTVQYVCIVGSSDQSTEFVATPPRTLNVTNATWTQAQVHSAIQDFVQMSSTASITQKSQLNNLYAAGTLLTVLPFGVPEATLVVQLITSLSTSSRPQLLTPYGMYLSAMTRALPLTNSQTTAPTLLSLVQSVGRHTPISKDVVDSCLSLVNAIVPTLSVPTTSRWQTLQATAASPPKNMIASFLHSASEAIRHLLLSPGYAFGTIISSNLSSFSVSGIAQLNAFPNSALGLIQVAPVNTTRLSGVITLVELSTQIALPNVGASVGGKPTLLEYNAQNSNGVVVASNILLWDTSSMNVVAYKYDVTSTALTACTNNTSNTVSNCPVSNDPTQNFYLVSGYRKPTNNTTPSPDGDDASSCSSSYLPSWSILWKKYLIPIVSVLVVVIILVILILVICCVRRRRRQQIILQLPTEPTYQVEARKGATRSSSSKTVSIEVVDMPIKKSG